MKIYNMWSWGRITAWCCNPLDCGCEGPSSQRGQLYLWHGMQEKKVTWQPVLLKGLWRSERGSRADVLITVAWGLRWLPAWEGNGFTWDGEFDLLTSFIPYHLTHCLRLSSFSMCSFLSLLANLSLIYSMIHNPRDGPCWDMFFSWDFHLK